MNGIFCANFATPRSGWQACHSVWCGSCYTPSDTVTFHRTLPQDESGFHWSVAKDVDRHLSARDGDHLVTPFQCDICVFRNIQGRNPGSHDGLVMACIRQANLDACWGRETATVSSPLRAVRQTIQLLSATYQQFETIRKLRAGYSNVHMASLIGQDSLRFMGGDKAKQYICSCPTNSLPRVV